MTTTVRHCSTQTSLKDVVFFNPTVQNLLQKLTGMDYEKVFKRRRLGVAPARPIYQFMTEEELQEAEKEVQKKAVHKLSSPPVMDERLTTTRLLEEDELLVGFDTAKYVFTDITFGVSDRSRIIVVREPDGKLRTSGWEEQDRINQVYYPKSGRKHYVPAMFEPESLKNLLGPDKYEYILDRNCLQFEPDHPIYLSTVEAVYNHILEQGNFDILHSTRHYGPMVFNLCWNCQVDELLIHLVMKDRMMEVKDTIKLYLEIHRDCKMGNSVGDIEESSPEDLVRSFSKQESLKPGKLSMALERLLETRRAAENIRSSLAGVDPKLQGFIQQETERQRFQGVIHDLNEKCWDVCMDGKPSNRLDGKQENCLKNCVDRFIDTNISIAQRFEKKAAELGAAGGEMSFD